jgi:hypothetical protein
VALPDATMGFSSQLTGMSIDVLSLARPWQRNTLTIATGTEKHNSWKSAVGRAFSALSVFAGINYRQTPSLREF